MNATKKIKSRLFASIFLALLTLLAGPMIPSPASAAERLNLFGTREFRSEGLVKFPKWQNTLKRFADEKSVSAKSGANSKCRSGLFRTCDIQEWRDFLDDIANEDKRWQIDLVQKHINEARYIVDPINWGMPDYWATPFQFLDRDGDCEDYAIAKFMSLRALGFSNDKMRIVVLQDLNLGVAHAVLAVQHHGEVLILDNQNTHVIEASRIHHYKPFYSVNETGWWLHLKMKNKRG